MSSPERQQRCGARFNVWRYDMPSGCAGHEYHGECPGQCAPRRSGCRHRVAVIETTPPSPAVGVSLEQED